MGTASIYSYGSPVVDITGYTMKVVANYRDKNSDTAADHSASDASPNLSNGISLIALTVTTIKPVSKIFDRLWSVSKDKNGQTMRDRAAVQAVQQIQSNGGINIKGGFPETGTLLALAEPTGGEFFLSYWLPNAQFTFNKGPLGARWNLTFDTELFIQLLLSDWPNVPEPTGIINLENANISAANTGASIDEDWEQLATFFSTSNSGIDGGNLFATQEGTIDSTGAPPVDLPSLWKLIRNLANQSYPVGFTKCGVFLGATVADTVQGTPVPTLNIHLVHPIDAGPPLSDAADKGFRVPQLTPPVITVIPTQVPAGGKTLVTGRHFRPAQANAIYLKWQDDTVSGALVGSEIRWSAPDQPAKQIVLKPVENPGYTITGLAADTSYKVQVRDADLLTYTDWSTLTIKTDKNNSVDLSLQTGHTGVPLGSAERDGGGNFTANVTVLAGTATGGHTIMATSGSVSASIMVEVLGIGHSPTPKLYVINPTMGSLMDPPVTMTQGETFDLQGEGFEQGAVSLTIEGKSLGEPKVGDDGAFSAKVSSPIESGSYTIVASQGSGTTQRQVTLSLSVLPQPT